MAEKEKSPDNLIKRLVQRINENSGKDQRMGKAIKLLLPDIAVTYWMKLSDERQCGDG